MTAPARLRKAGYFPVPERKKEFLENYGVAIANGPLAGLAARAVVVLDEQNRVLHSELVAEIKNEPDYAAALADL